MAMRGISGDAHFFEESMNWDRIRKLLDNKLGVAGHSEKLEAMKALLASISKGEDVSMFFADVVKNVIVASVEVKKLVYMYLVHYADANSQCRELALLSINSFQKDLADPNQLIRALALRVMTSIRVRDILQIQLIAIRKCTADSSAYVRKCAANAISKIFVVDPEQKDVLAEIIGKLLNDSSTMVLGSAVQALVEVCPDRLDLLHRPFRKMCHLLADLDEWGQTVTINVLIRYCHEQFQSPQIFNQGGSESDPAKRKNMKEMFPKRKVKRGFYSDEEGSDSDNDKKSLLRSQGGFQQSPFHLGSGAAKREALPSIGSVFRSDALASGIGGGEELDEDHRLLLRSSIPLLKSRNSAVVLAVATLHYYCGTHSVATSTLIGKSLVRIMRSQREIQYVVLSVISSMAASRPDMFRPFLQDFFVRATDPGYARKLKLEIMTALVTDDNVSVILREFQAYVRHVDKSFVTTTVRALGRVADAMPSVAERCLSGLMRLVRSSNEQVVAESVVVIRQLLQQQAIEKDRLRVVRSLAAMMVTGRVTSASARASIVWMLGEFNDEGNATICAAETLRLLVKNFSDEATEVRIQLLNLAVKLGLREPQKRPIQLLLQYVIELCKFDTEYDVRDRARLIRATLSGDANIVNPHKLFASKKPAPLIGCEEETKRRFTLGTLSDIVRHSVPGYAPLPHWRMDKPDSSLRDESSSSYMDDDRSREDSRHGSKPSKKDKRKKDSGFYSEEDSPSGSSDGSGSESELGSDASSEYDSSERSGSDSEPESSRSGSGSGSGSESDVSSSEASEEESSEDSEDDRRRRRQTRNKSKKAASVSPQKKQSAKKPVDLFDPLGLLDTPSPAGGSAAQNAFGNQNMSLSSSFGPSTTSTSNGNNLLGDLMNLSMATSSTAPAAKRELLSSLTGNGLDIQYSFLRQPSMYSPTMNLIQLWISNNSDAPISRIQVIAKNQQSGSSGRQQVMSFPEIPVLFPGGTPSMAQLHVDFAGRLDKIALQVVTHEETYDVDLAPVSGEILAPQQMSLEEFGQRISMSDASSLHTSDFFLPVPVQLEMLVQAVVKDTNVAQVYEINNMTLNVGKCKFTGRLRGGTGEIVLLGMEFQVQTGKTRLLVVSSDVVLAQRLATNIKRNLPIREA